MERLRTQIISSRVKNSDGHYFVPGSTILDFITASPVLETLRDCNVVVQDLDELTQTILGGARIVFAILVCIRQVQHASHFVRHDQFQTPVVKIDHKLPFQREVLEQILLPVAAKKFFERQWEFTAPTFSKRVFPRSLTEDTILPILEDKIIGMGGFGEAHEISIHSNHVDFGDTVGRTVRKVKQGLQDNKAWLTWRFAVRTKGVPSPCRTNDRL